MVFIEPRHYIYDLQGVIKRHTHVGRGVPIGEFFRPIYFNHSSLEVTIKLLQTQENNCDINADTGQISTCVEILRTMSHNMLDKRSGVITMIDRQFKGEIAQRKLSNLAVRPLHFDRFTTRIIKSGSPCSLHCLGGTYKLLRGYPPSPQLENKPFSKWRGVFIIILSLYLYRDCISSVDESRWACVPCE